jgi:hypothetical protein
MRAVSPNVPAPRLPGTDRKFIIPRFYFHVRHDDRLDRDDVGTLLPGVRAAFDHAGSLALERSAISNSGVRSVNVHEVIDELGTRLFSLPFRTISAIVTP